MKCLIISIMLILRFKVREMGDEVMRVDFPLLSKLVIGKKSFIKGENVVIESMILRKVMK